MKKADITPGMIFYKVKTNWRSSTKEIEELTVVSVGNKYMEMSNRDKVTIETLTHEDRDYTQHQYKVYLTRQEIEDVFEANDLKRVISEFFRYSVKLSLEQLRSVKKIIDEAQV